MDTAPAPSRPCAASIEARAFLSFSPYRLRVLMFPPNCRERAELWATTVRQWLAGQDRTALARAATGRHATLAEARDYGRREGPMVVLAPDGDVFEVERARDPVLDARIAAEERAHADRLRLLAEDHRHP